MRLALAVAEQDVDRTPKELHARPDAGEGVVETYRFPNGTSEARGIAELCRRLRDDEAVEPGGILVLLRSDPQHVYSDPIVEELAEAGFDAELPQDPFAVLDEGDPRALVCVLRLLRDGTDGLAWRELLELRDNHIGAPTLLRVYRLADERGERYYDTLRAIADDPDIFESPIRARLADEVEAVEELLQDLGELFEESAAEALETVLDRLAFVDHEERSAVVDLLLELCPDDEATLADVEQALHASRSAMESGVSEEPETDRARIMSTHSAKGLTAEAVIVAACEDELIPGDLQDRRELDDQRRLLYVSLTRARHYLYITYATRRPGRQSHILGLPVRRTLTQFSRDYVTPRSI